MATSTVSKKSSTPLKKKSKKRLTALCPKLSKIKDLEFNANEVEFLFGLDEVGVACLAGPVVAACFAYPVNAAWVSGKIPPLIRDSKQLKAAQREEGEKWIRAQSDVFFAVAEASVEEIDQLNIYWASRLAMVRAFRAVESLVNERYVQSETGKRCVLVDGNQPPKEFKQLGDNYLSQALVKGDTRVFPIAAASILAKNYRDSLMQKLALEFSHYGWETNVGYPTETHREGIIRHGITPWHRRSFNLDFVERQTELF